ncbi:hypothetical protein [Mycobacterium gordonae]|uniref:Glycine-rich domain-containing protein n=1 Tax=Mycobacterium gordonae TaxID=1778 RepID=A0A1X1VIN1_MYCGO|nr:hypothetical protein [Mycobacterium gordonae]MCV7009493.1 hypothetical protein [Mycobacterium gordonae]ODR20727.1 hypothetical protein BHQ23_14965 [Mycobacterium gordonae]ORV68906.1 hypothetical protein AWC08_06855 [Mycobacterium gordonae]
MSKPGIRAVRIRKGDRVLHVHGALAGTEGVWIAASQVTGLYDAPVVTTYKSGAFQEGSTHRWTRRPHRDLLLGFHVRETSSAYELNDSVLRLMFDYEEDPWDPSPEPTTIEVETDLSGIRKIDVLMYEEPEFVPKLDPLAQEFGNIIYKLRASDPMWYEDTVVDSFASEETGTATGFVTVENPTDNIMYHKWVLTPATWWIPDFQWVGAKGAREPGGANGDRVVPAVNVTLGNGGAVGDLDRQELMWRDANDTNILGQFGSTKILIYPIPPYTPPTLLPLSYIGAPVGGAMAQLRMPLRWSRPWGLELDADPNALKPLESVFTTPGSYSYTIPPTATHIDVVLIGGGGGGSGASSYNYGGYGGGWAYATLERGVDIPWETEIIRGVIGGGGSPGGWIAPLVSVPSSPGGATTATADGMTPLSASGGAAGPPGGPFAVGFGAGYPPSPQVLSFNGRNYYGGPVASLAGGNAPGGGGSGGVPLGGGYPGARGQAWFYAYHVEDEGSA